MDCLPKKQRKPIESELNGSKLSFDGGRLAKIAKNVISIAPFKALGRSTLMSVSSVALGTVLASSVFAGKGIAQCSVSNETTDSATFVCSGTINSRHRLDFGSSLLTSNNRNRDINVQFTSSAQLTIATSGLGTSSFFYIEGQRSGSHSMTVTQAPGGQDINITGTTLNTGVNVFRLNGGNGNSSAKISLHLTGDIIGVGRLTAIAVSSKDTSSYAIGRGDVTITAQNITMSGRADTRGYGVNVFETGGNISVTVGNVKTGHTAVRLTGTTQTGLITLSAGNLQSYDQYALSIFSPGGNFSGTVGNVTTSGRQGVRIAGGNANSSNVNLVTGSVSGGRAGIVIRQSGTGSSSVYIRSNGNVRGNGSNTHTGILSIGSDAIHTYVKSGNLTIKVYGDVIGGTGTDNSGIDARVGGLTTITVSGGTISGGQNAISTNNGSSDITIHNVNLNADIETGSGLDIVTIAGNNTFANGVVIDAGEDSGETASSTNTAKDLFNVASGTFTFSSLDFTTTYKNFERVGARAGGVLTFTGSSTVSFEEVVLNKGTISLKGSGTDEALTISGNLTTGGILSIDVDFSTGSADTITISGNLTGTHTLRVTDVTPANAFTRVTTPIEVVTVGGTTQASALSLENDELLSGLYLYTLDYVSTTKKFVLNGTLLGAPECTEDSNTLSTFVCNGTISATQWIITTGSTNSVVSLDDAASVSVTNSWAFRVVSQAGITFTQETGGSPINATGTAPGVLMAMTSGSGDVSVTFVNSITQTSSGTTIDIQSTGSGDVGLTVTDVTATNGSATSIRVEGAGGDVSVRANSVNGGQAAIIARNMSSSGTVMINASGNIGSTGGHAIYAYSKGSSITISAGSAVRGGKSGIIAANEGSGDGSVSIQTSGAISGTNRDGIYAYNRANGDLTITTNGAVTGKRYGIDARNYNSGNILITTTAQVTGGTGTGEDGISALNDGSGGITIVAQNVTGDDDGIEARNKDGGSVSVTVNGDLRGRGTGRYDAGVFIQNDSYGDSVTVSVVSAASVTGGYGVYVENLGSGSVSITTVGSIRGATHEGIYVDNRGTTTDIEVMNVEGSGHGIDLRHEGSGTATITVVSSGAVRGGEKGIKIVSESDADVSLTSSGAISGSGEQGIYALLEGNGNLSITTIASVTGGAEGIDAELDGSGDLSITVSSVTGGQEGIKARKFGDGDLTISATGAVTAGNNSGDDGIYAYADGVGDLSVTVGSVTGDDDGLVLRHYGSGTLTATVTGEVVGNGTGSSDAGISSYGDSKAGTLMFDLSASSDVEGYYGLLLHRKGSGSIVVNASGSIEGKTSDGMDVTAEDGANITINVNGNVTGATSKIAIDTYTETGTTTIILNSGTVSAPDGTPTTSSRVCLGSTCVTPVSPSTMGLAIRNNDGASTVTANSGASITSGISLGGGVDVLTFNGSTPPSSAMLDGGSDSGNTQSVDKLNFNGVTATLNAGYIKNWEEVSIGSGSTLTFIGGQSLATKELKLAGILSMQNEKTEDQFYLNGGNLTGSGIIAIDIDFSTGTADNINIAGNLTGTHTIRVEDVSPSNVTRRVVHNTTPSLGTIVLDKPIVVATVTGTTAANALRLEHSLVISRGFEYRLSYSTDLKSFVLTGKKGDFVCQESDSVEGQFSCVGAVIVTENLVKSRTTAIVANLSAATTVNVSSNVAFNVGGGGSITFTQEAGGAALNATGTATGVLSARTIGSGAVTINLTGDVSLAGSGNAIFVESTGTANVSVVAGKVTANHTGGTAINVQGSGASVTVSAREVSGGGMAIVGKNNNSSGVLSINTTGAITSNSGDAIYAYGKGTSVAVNVASSTTASGVSVKAVNKGEGSATVITSADITSTNGRAIHAYGLGTSVSVTTSGIIQANGTGIEAMNKGSGTVILNANDDVTSSNGIAIHAYGTGTGVSVSTVADVTGSSVGIKAENQGSGEGSVTIVAAGAVVATAGTAIEGRIASSGTLSVTSEVVTGTSVGILAIGTGEGNVSITASGDISVNDSGIGIDTGTASGTTTVMVESGLVKGATSIRNNGGDSEVTIKSNATIAGNISLGGGADVLNLNGGTIQSTVSFDGGSDSDNSVDTINFNAGNLLLSDVSFTNFERIGVGRGAKIRFDGNVSQTIGEIRLSRGAIGLQDRSAGDNLIITGNLSSESTSNYGIIEIDVNFSSGTSDTVTVSGNLSGRHVIKIADVTPSALRTRTGDPITVVTVAGTADKDAVKIDEGEFSSGGYKYTVQFDATRKIYTLVGERGTLNCTLASDQVNFTCSGKIQFTENVSGEDDKDLVVTLDSLADVMVDSEVAFRLTGSGNITFTQERGGIGLKAVGAATGVILATTSGNKDISITVTGSTSLLNGGTAIRAMSTGTGNVSISTRDVSAGHGSGTAIRAEGLGSSVSVSAGAVTGGQYGIYAKNTGTTGSVSITATGAITSSGIPVHAESRSGSISVNVAGVVGGTNGIIAKTIGGSGSIAITSTGTVTANSTAIVVDHKGSGSVTVNATSSAKGAGIDGINIKNSESGGRLSVTAAGAEGRRHGLRVENNSDGIVSISLGGKIAGTRSSAIHAENTGTGALNVSIAGSVQGGANGAGIDTITDGGQTNITLVRGANVSGGTGIAIRNDEGASSLVINRGATLSGTAQLGGGVDTIIIAGGNIGSSILDGGEDATVTDTSIDVLTINGGSVTLRANQFLNWERFVLGTSGELRANGEVSLRTENISLRGNLTLRDGIADDALTLNGNVEGGGTIHVDVDFFVGNADIVNITGNVTGTTSIVMNDISTAVGGSDRIPISIVTVTGSVSESAFSLTNAGRSGPNRYELTFDDNSKSFFLNKKESVGSLMLVSVPVTLFDSFARAPSLQQRHTDRGVNNSWVRMIGVGRDYGDATGEKAEYESDSTGIQMGYDLLRSTGPSGTWVFGATMQFNETRTDVTAVSSEGLMKATGYGIGGTATWYGEDGGYIDIQTQINLIDSEFKTDNLGFLMNEVNSTALILSFETGNSFEMSEQLTATPSVQLSWGRVGTTDFVTSQRQPVKFGNDGGLMGRIGLGLTYSEDDYAIHFLGNLYYDTMDSWDVNFAGKNYTDSKSAISGEFGVGASTAISETSTAYLRAEYQTSFSEGFEHRKATKIAAGMRWSW